MINEDRFLNWLTLISFGIGLYSLYIALENLSLNDKQSGELKQILNYLEQHLEDQDNHLEAQDRILENLTKGE